MAQGKQVVQVHLATGNTKMWTWVDAQLRPKIGMKLQLNGDRRTWEVIWAGTLPRDVDSVPPVKVVN